ncbi:MAG: hypothetical protein P1P89_11350 [Desulfobacterales bacterium]|nr:hypothetical protein [Desulfobacterales bacterium]
MKVGSGDFIYEVIHNWGRLPAGWSLGSVPNGACDSQGRVYVFTRSEHPVLVFDPDGRFLGSWGEDIFSRPHGILITPDDIAYCTDDKDHTVRKCTLDGKVLMTLGTKDQPTDTGYDGKNWRTIKKSGPPFHRPTNLALSPGGDMYVSDGYGNARVHKFSPEGKLLFSWGEPGDGPGQFAIVHSVRTDKKGLSTSLTGKTPASSCLPPRVNLSPSGRTCRSPRDSTWVRMGCSIPLKSR